MATQTEVRPQTSSQLMDTAVPIREFLLLAGKDSTGKTSAVVSLARYVELMSPDVTVYVIDTENKFKGAMRSFGSDAPTNVVYYKCSSMNDVTSSTATILERHKPGDWLAVESLSRVWELAQDLGYQVQEGVGKAEYLEKKRGDRKSPIPGNPGDFWAVVKGAHDSAFFHLLTQVDDLNVICTTTIAKPPKEMSNRKENVDRKALRVELGIDSNLEGAPRLPYYVESLALLDLVGGNVTCRVLRDNLSTKDDTRIEFPVPDKKSWGFAFYESCRG
jgi:hypothetical protein